MSRRKMMSNLEKIGDMLFDKQMHALQTAAAERNHILALLRDLTPKSVNEPQTIAEAQAALRYDRWADARRADINLVLATKTAEWLQAKENAERAWARADVLKKIYKRESICPSVYD